MEFVGPGVEKLSADFRIGVDVMTTETTCLSSIWKTDDVIKDFYDIHGRAGDYKELNPAPVAYYDGMVKIDLSKIRPMIAMPFHPSNTYTIEDMNRNLMDVLHDCEQKALVSLDGQVDFKLTDKVHNGKLYVEQGIIAGDVYKRQMQRRLLCINMPDLKKSEKERIIMNIHRKMPGLCYGNLKNTNSY